MKTWEFDVEMRVRQTFVFGGPTTEEAARQIMDLALFSRLDASHLFKWKEGPSPHRPVPDMTIIDDDPRIVAVREVEND